MTYNIRFLRRSDLEEAARMLGVTVEVVKAVAEVESAGDGFIKGTDLPKILFEGHWFHRHTNGRFDSEYPSISHKKWTKEYYKGGRGEYDRLLQAIKLAKDPEAALLSASWGRFQIMGFNYRECGYSSVTDFVNHNSEGEDVQLMSFVKYIIAKGLADELRQKDWERFARAYNGAGFKKNQYDTKMAAQFAKALAQSERDQRGGLISMERGDCKVLQVALNVALGDALTEKLTPDGWMGEKTARAIRVFCRENNLPESDQVTAELYAALGLDAIPIASAATPTMTTGQGE